MPRKTPTAPRASTIELPIDAYLELQAFHNELVGIAHTIDPVDPASAPPVRKSEQSRRRALARVFRLWAGQIERTLASVPQ
ncbi:XAC0095 family protein [Pseudomonas sp. CGJS7]|uniref:XAC0095 family protein n=1 Tax=Pseudomonas sp. CGJS7 TaxID=3109348 RepID=UPI0030088B1D